MTDHFARGEEVNFTVTGAQHYGVLIRTDSGERGWIESDYVSDVRPGRDEWPGVGTALRGLVLGYTKDGRIRIALRHVDGRQSPDRWPPGSIADETNDTS